MKSVSDITTLYFLTSTLLGNIIILIVQSSTFSTIKQIEMTMESMSRKGSGTIDFGTSGQKFWVNVTTITSDLSKSLTYCLEGSSPYQVWGFESFLGFIMMHALYSFAQFTRSSKKLWIIIQSYVPPIFPSPCKPC